MGRDDDDRVDLEILRKPSGRSFLRELDAAPQLLRPKDASHFFKILLAHFVRGVDTSIGEAILLCISRVLAMGNITETFLAGSFALALPFSQTQFIDAVYDVLFVLLQQSTDVFDEELAGQVGKLAQKDPFKALVLIAHFCQDFAEARDPWPMVDTLFKCQVQFQRAEVIDEYVSLFAFLYRRFPDFRKERGQACWDTLCGMLDVTRDVQSLRSVYGGLAAIADGRMNVEIPMEAVKRHLMDDELADQVLSFLLVRPPKPPQSNDEEFVGAVVKLAHEDVKATLLLMKLATHRDVAKLLLVDSSWIIDGLPTILDTLRVFFVVLKHKGLRERISELPDLIGFLKNVIEDADSSTLALTGTILRRLVLSKDFVTELSRSGFLHDFMANARACGDLTAGKSLLVLFNTIAPHGFASEYVRMCDLISREIVGDGELSHVAADVAISLCIYQKCVNRMREKRLDAFFKKRRQDADWDEQAEEFLEAIGGAVEIDDRNYYSEASSYSESSG